MNDRHAEAIRALARAIHSLATESGKSGFKTLEDHVNDILSSEALAPVAAEPAVVEPAAEHVSVRPPSAEGHRGES